MSPVERRSSTATTRAVLVGVAGVVAGIALVLFVVNLADSGSERFEIRLGDDRFDAGDAASRAASIDAGGPILFSDLAGGSRDILLQHLGDDPEAGWHAFAAQPPGAPRDCVLQWQADAGEFVDCEGDVWPADGTGLPSYPVTIEDGGLLVDLNAEFREVDDDVEGDEEPAGDDPVISGDAPTTTAG
ncbi:MAG TPA: hypothetical protein VK866_17255 [Acidimicrobiales bacterium]|nr:hypothetical protein [Acidimicrobiales bacterium]